VRAGNAGMGTSEHRARSTKLCCEHMEPVGNGFREAEEQPAAEQDERADPRKSCPQFAQRLDSSVWRETLCDPPERFPRGAREPPQSRTEDEGDEGETADEHRKAAAPRVSDGCNRRGRRVVLRRRRQPRKPRASRGRSSGALG
jgi:hypothetical protein